MNHIVQEMEADNLMLCDFFMRCSADVSLFDKGVLSLTLRLNHMTEGIHNILWDLLFPATLRCQCKSFLVITLLVQHNKCSIFPLYMALRTLPSDVDAFAHVHDRQPAAVFYFAGVYLVGLSMFGPECAYCCPIN